MGSIQCVQQGCAAARGGGNHRSPWAWVLTEPKPSGHPAPSRTGSTEASGWTPQPGSRGPGQACPAKKKAGSPEPCTCPQGLSWGLWPPHHPPQMSHSGGQTPGGTQGPSIRPHLLLPPTLPPRDTATSAGSSKADGRDCGLHQVRIWAAVAAPPPPCPGDRPYCPSLCHYGHWNVISNSDMACAQNQEPSLQPTVPTHCPPNGTG